MEPKGRIHARTVNAPKLCVDLGSGSLTSDAKSLGRLSASGDAFSGPGQVAGCADSRHLIFAQDISVYRIRPAAAEDPIVASR